MLHTTNTAFHTKNVSGMRKPSAKFLPLPPISNRTVMNRIAKPIALAAMLLVVLAGCRHKNPNNTLHSDENAVYFWQTWYSTNDYEKRFLFVPLHSEKNKKEKRKLKHSRLSEHPLNSTDNGLVE